MIVNLYSRLISERKRLQLSQSEIAGKCGVSREMWGKYERDVARPGADVLARLAELGADIHYLLVGDTRTFADSLEHVRRATAIAQSVGGSIEEQTRLRDALVSHEPPPGFGYNEIERTLVGHYRTADESGKSAIFATARALSAKESDLAPQSANPAAQRSAPKAVRPKKEPKS